jgi:hypothetical protein
MERDERAPGATRVNTGRVPRAERDLRVALGQLLTGSGIARPVRREIVESWRRVASSGLRPDRFQPSYDPDLDEGSRLEHAAAPVMNRLADDLAGTETSLLLTDERAHVVDRRVSDPGSTPDSTTSFSRPASTTTKRTRGRTGSAPRWRRAARPS